MLSGRGRTDQDSFGSLAEVMGDCSVAPRFFTRFLLDTY